MFVRLVFRDEFYTPLVSAEAGIIKFIDRFSPVWARISFERWSADRNRQLLVVAEQKPLVAAHRSHVTYIWWGIMDYNQSVSQSVSQSSPSRTSSSTPKRLHAEPKPLRPTIIISFNLLSISENTSPQRPKTFHSQVKLDHGRFWAAIIIKFNTVTTRARITRMIYRTTQAHYSNLNSINRLNHISSPINQTSPNKLLLQ